MSREIKFRGVHPSSCVVMDVCVIDWMHDEVYFEQGSDVSYSIDDCNLMQFTGLKDKNGVEIYEGDIVQVAYGSGEIVINETVCYLVNKFELSWSCLNGFYGRSASLRASELIEVIGNIHQNPDLVK